MILYRIRGCAELWKGCGKLAISPRVSTNRTVLEKRFKRVCAKFKSQEKAFNLTLEQITIKDIKAPDLVELFSTEDPTALIQSFKAINGMAFIPEEINEN